MYALECISVMRSCYSKCHFRYFPQATDTAEKPKPNEDIDSGRNSVNSPVLGVGALVLPRGGARVCPSGPRGGLWVTGS